MPRPRRPRAQSTKDEKQQPATPKAGDNVGLSPDTFHTHTRKVKLAKRDLETAQGTYRAALKAAKAAGIDQAQLLRAIADTKHDSDEIRVREQTYQKYMAWLGMPVGTQASLLDELPKPTEKTQADLNLWAAEDAGFESGKSGGSIGANPYEPGSPHHFEWDKGFRAGLASIAAQMADGVMKKSGGGRSAGAPAERFN